MCVSVGIIMDLVKKATVERREEKREERRMTAAPSPASSQREDRIQKKAGGRLDPDARRTTSKPPSSVGRHTYPGHPAVPDDTTDSTCAVDVEARQRPTHEYSTALRETPLLEALGGKSRTFEDRRGHKPCDRGGVQRGI